MTRWQLTFRRGEATKYVGHLDLSRSWLRAMRRAGIALAHSAGFHPHPKLAFAAPLPVGVLGLAELIDVTVSTAISADELSRCLAAQLPAGLDLVAVDPLSGPALASRVRYARYRALLDGGPSAAEIAWRAADLLSATALPRVRPRERGGQSYDLRPLIADLGVEAPDGGEKGLPRPATLLTMHVRLSNEGAGRPDEVLDALGLREAAVRIERTSLELAGLGVNG